RSARRDSLRPICLQGGCIHAASSETPVAWPAERLGSTLARSAKTSQINTGVRTFDRWFNTSDFERVAARGPAAFQSRVFPTRIHGLRADYTNCINSTLQRDFRVHERAGFQVRLGALNLTNRTQFGAPETNPPSTNFGTVTIQSQTNKRTVQLQGRICF